MRNPFRHDYGLDAIWEWNALAKYNAECSRGIVHTSEWDEQMAQQQEAFNAQQAARMGEDLSANKERERS